MRHTGSATTFVYAKTDQRRLALVHDRGTSHAGPSTSWAFGSRHRLEAGAKISRLPANAAASVDDDGRIHVASVKAIQEPPSLARKRIEAMMPRVDISEAILEVLGWCPQFTDSLASISGTDPHLADLDISVAAVPDRTGTEHHLHPDRHQRDPGTGAAPSRRGLRAGQHLDCVYGFSECLWVKDRYRW